MAVVAGIDEAGYGPLLGPLVVSATAFRLPDEALGADLWERFADAVCKGAPRKSGRLQVADSKVIHKCAEGVRALERNLLPFLALLGPLPTGLRAHLERLRCANVACLDGYPWYRGRDLPLPHSVEAPALLDGAQLLQSRLAAAGGAFIDARTELLDAAEFNREVKSAGLKSVTLARRIAVLMQHLWQTLAEEKVLLVVDKQGGRHMYSTFLRAVFSDAEVRTFEEGADRSAYEVTDGRRALHVRFEPYADSRYLPVALASMLSKYTRELCMELLNSYWRPRVADLKPTAGYYQDGKRFLLEIDAARRAEGIARDLLERCR